MNTQDTVEKFVEELKDLGWFHSTHGKEAFSFTQIQWIRKTLTAVAEEAEKQGFARGQLAEIEANAVSDITIAKEKKDGLLLV